MKTGKLGNLSIAVLTILLGLVLFIWSGATLTVICRVVGIGFLLAAAIAFFVGYKSHEFRFPFIAYITGGVVALIAGIVLLAKPEFVIALLPIVTGIGIAANGIINLIDAIRFQKVGVPAMPVVILSAITIVLGIVILANPFSTMEFLVKVMGIVLIYNGIVNCIAAMRRQ